MAPRVTPPRRRALLVGILYRGTSSELNGCINDVEGVKAFLLTKGYVSDDITVLTDDTDEKPTRANIIRALVELLLSGAPTLFFHYSGHGTYTYDAGGDEADSRDECLVPIDYDDVGPITDDSLRGLLDSMLPSQSLFCVLDCCHSGSGLDLCYALYERVGSSRLSMLRESKAVGPTPGPVVMLSGCTDSQTSADAFVGGKYQGALTYAFLKHTDAPTYEALVTSIRRTLTSEEYSQRPALSSGQKLTLTAPLRF